MRTLIVMLLLCLLAIPATAGTFDLFVPDEWGSAAFVVGSQNAGDLRLTVASKHVLHVGEVDGFVSVLNPLEPQSGFGLDGGASGQTLRGGIGYIDRQHWGLYLRSRW